MNSQEILKFCLERGFLLDNEVLNLFDETSDVESVKLIIERIKDYTHQKIITKNLFNQNKDKVVQIFSTLPRENQKQLEKLKIKLGLSIEISKEFSEEKKIEEKEKKISEDQLKEGEARIQKFTDEHIKTVDDILKHKEKEIMEV